MPYEAFKGIAQRNWVTLPTEELFSESIIDAAFMLEQITLNPGSSGSYTAAHHTYRCQLWWLHTEMLHGQMVIDSR
jgi:hypothetical protein